jgi:hypothetical protein
VKEGVKSRAAAASTTTKMFEEGEGRRRRAGEGGRLPVRAHAQPDVGPAGGARIVVDNCRSLDAAKTCWPK